MQIQEDHSNPIPVLNVDSLKVDLVVIQNTCSEKEDSNLESASCKSVKESSLNSATKDVHAIKYKMSKAKERCMSYFRSLYPHLQVLFKEDLKGQQHTKQPEIINEGRVDQSKTIEQTTSLLANNADLKAQIHEKVFAIAALKNDLRKLAGNSVDTKFAKTSVLGIPFFQSLRNQSVIRQPNAFISERPQMSKPRFVSQVDVNNNFSRPVTQHYLHKKRESAFAKPNHMIASSSSRNSSKNMPRFSSNDMVHNYFLEEAWRKPPERNRNSKSSVMHTTSPQNTTKDSKLKPRSNNQTSRSLHVSKSSCVMITAVPKANHSKSSSFLSDSKHFFCSTCHKCVFNVNHDACITKLLKEVNSRAKIQSNKTRNRNKPIDQKSHTQIPRRQIFIGHRFSPNKTSAMYEKTSTRSDLRWKPSCIIFKFVGLRWIPIGKLFDSCTSKVDSEPPHYLSISHHLSMSMWSRVQVDQESQIKMIQIKEMVQDKDLKNSKSKDKGTRSRSLSMNEQSHYKQEKTKTRPNLGITSLYHALNSQSSQVKSPSKGHGSPRSNPYDKSVSLLTKAQCGNISDGGDDYNGGGDDYNVSGGADRDLQLLRDGDGKGDSGGEYGDDDDDGDNLALLRGGAAISSTIAVSIACERVNGARTLFFKGSIMSGPLRETGSSDGLQPKQADLSCVHVLNELHLHENHVVLSKPYATLYQREKHGYDELTDAEKIYKACDIRVTNNVLQGLPQDINNLVNHHEEAKAIGDRVKLLIEGSEILVQKNKSKLYDEFDTFTSVPRETSHSYYISFGQLINDMHIIGMTMKPIQINIKFINHLQPE
nr:integrase, catalytic region, zinc finger, CCHC-type, peptidase aspartic, catalytic [Tanacetum cinerariifolium]